MDLEPLGDIFGPSPGGQASPSTDTVLLQEFDFDPDKAPPPPVPVVAPARPQPEPAHALPPPRQRPRPAPSIDPEELRRRIQGSGSEPLSFWQQARQRASAGCRQGRERFAENPRLFLLAGLVVCMVLFGGIAWNLRVATDAPPDAATLTEDARRPSRASDLRGSDTGGGTSGGADREGSAGAPDDDAGDQATAKAGSRGEQADEPRAGSSRWTRDMAALRDLVSAGNRDVKEELKALRREVVKLRKRFAAQGGSSGADAGTSSKPEEPDDDEEPQRPRSSVGRVKSETPARGKPTRPPQPKEEDDDRGGSVAFNAGEPRGVGEVRIR